MWPLANVVGASAINHATTMVTMAIAVMIAAPSAAMNDAINAVMTGMTTARLAKVAVADERLQEGGVGVGADAVGPLPG
jgi:hypothetical protein